MHLLFTRSNKLFSKLIMGVTMEGVSHVALYFPEYQIVVHSNILGLHIESYGSFIKHSRIVRALKSPSDPNEISKLMKLLEKYEWSAYDFGALLFLGFNLILRNYCKIPLPKSNLWQSSGMFLCTEWVEKYLDLKPNNNMATPMKIYYSLNWRPDWEIMKI